MQRKLRGLLQNFTVWGTIIKKIEGVCIILQFQLSECVKELTKEGPWAICTINTLCSNEVGGPIFVTDANYV